ncbi:hypothetical protein PLESTB_001853900 [Pleodorina starrii]|uniref:SURF1-like protein n=1 Tax=Pleodorina starrii TaxID=330485 RepID=A0A9W6C1S1_9CHLO|nr:hypothetical protein PLESTB_001853900 [Pleodorina starrii]GLC69988.1 hypothetical protein PLESTF_000907200 [Pleodorina starrii]
MRRLASRGLGALGAVAQSTQASNCSSSANAFPGAVRRWWANAAASATATGGAGRAGAASDSGGSGWSPFSVVMFIPSAVCGCLAYWQYERMKWKNELIALRQGIAEAEARDLFDLDEPPREYDKVQVRGRLLDEYSLFVGPRPRSVPGSGIQPGYIVVTPMLCSDRKGVVLVNRGWVPTSWKEEKEAAAAAKAREAAAQAAKEKEAAAAAAATAASAQPAAATGSRSWWGWFTGGGGGNAQPPPQQQEPPQPQATRQAAAVPEPEVVVGVIQFDEQPSQFMPDNRPEADEFHFIQREHMARVLGLPPDTPLIMALSTDPTAVQVVQKRSPLEEARSAASSSSGAAATPTYPAPKHVADLVRFTTMPGDHLNYALIWAALCVTLAVMGRTAVTKPLRGPRIVEEPGSSARDAWKASQAN